MTAWAAIFYVSIIHIRIYICIQIIIFKLFRASKYVFQMDKELIEKSDFEAPRNS